MSGIGPVVTGATQFDDADPNLCIFPNSKLTIVTTGYMLCMWNVQMGQVTLCSDGGLHVCDIV
jgi:hypothetical protein